MEGIFEGLVRDLAMLAVVLVLIGAAGGASIYSIWTHHQQHGTKCEQQFGTARTVGDTLSVIRTGCNLSKIKEK